jgi:hypothetical protein
MRIRPFAPYASFEKMHETLRRIIEAANAHGLPFLIIGGNALILLGYIRNTIDIDLLVEGEKRSKWLDLMRELGLRFLHATGAFAQLEAVEAGDPGIDLMFVDSVTWKKLSDSSRQVTPQVMKCARRSPSTLSLSSFMRPQVRRGADRELIGKTSGRSFEFAGWISPIRNLEIWFGATVAKTLSIE